jgi:hypothetical protein
MFAVIRHYHFDSKNSAEIDRQVRENFVTLIKKARGFVRYYWLDTGKGEGASISVFQDKAGAEESVRLAVDYTRDHCRTHDSSDGESVLPEFTRAGIGLYGLAEQLQREGAAAFEESCNHH